MLSEIEDDCLSYTTADETQRISGLATTRVGSPELADSYQTGVSDDMERFNLASTASAQGAVTSDSCGRPSRGDLICTHCWFARLAHCCLSSLVVVWVVASRACVFARLVLAPVWALRLCREKRRARIFFEALVGAGTLGNAAQHD